MNPKLQLLPELGPGEIGIITAQIKEVAQTRVGDTITDAKKPAAAKAAGKRASQSQFAASHSTLGPAGSPHSVRKDLLRLVLRETLHRNGIPAAWLFSGWNCAAKTFARVRAAPKSMP